MTRETENSDPNAKTVIFAINPNSGAKDRRALCESIAKTLESDGFDVRLLTDLDDVESSTQEALSSGSLRAVVAAGGDGTVSLLANLLPRETPFAILPLGTENLLGRHLGLRAEESSFVSLIHSGKVTRLDAGDANGKLFFVVASCGFDAAVVKRLDETRTGHISYVSWLKPTFQTISKYRFPPLKLTIDGEEAVEPVRWAFIFNIPRYAMNLRITPDAMDADGKLDVCTFRGGGVIRGVWYLVATWLGMHKGISASSFSQFESMRIEAEDDQTVQYELDGDPGGVLPLEIQVRPKALKILVPDSRN
jgi:diacylglycerol kinase family enzyme